MTDEQERLLREAADFLDGEDYASNVVCCLAAELRKVLEPITDAEVEGALIGLEDYQPGDPLNLVAYHDLIERQARELRLALADADRYRWLRARWDANTEEDIELHSNAMNAPDPDAAIDAAQRGQREGE